MHSEFTPWVLMFAASATIAAFAQMLLKKSAMEEHKGVLGEYLNWKVILGYGMMFTGMLLCVIGYAHGVQVKSGSVMESIGIVEVALLSAALFKEKLTAKKLVGIALIITGIVVFNLA